MYADFTYYTTEYCGKAIKSEDDFTHFARKAERRLDTITGNKLQFAFPVEEWSIEMVKVCLCELTEFLYLVGFCQSAAINSVGVVEQADGTVKGKVVSSISSGSESISYSTGGFESTAITEAAKDRKVMDATVYNIVQNGLYAVPDANGVNLLYAGEYPGKREMWHEKF